MLNRTKEEWFTMKLAPFLGTVVFVIAALAAHTAMGACAQPGSLSDIGDTLVSCLHWISCPYCLYDPDRQEKRFHEALERDDPKTLAQVMYRRGRNPNEQLKKSADLPIIFAARRASINVIKTLLDAGADANSQMESPLAEYPSALIAVCAAEKLDGERVRQVVELLLKNGADPTRTCIMLTPGEYELLEQAKIHYKISHPEAIDVDSSWVLRAMPRNCIKPRSALEYARQNGYVAAAELLRREIAKAAANPRARGTSASDELRCRSAADKDLNDDDAQQWSDGY